MRITPTAEIARAIARDEANRNMRAHGRTAWNEDDYDVAVETFHRIYHEFEVVNA